MVPLVDAGVLQDSFTRFEMNIGSLLVEFNHRKTMVLSVHINTLPTVKVNARPISVFRRAARRAACSFNLGTVIFIGATDERQLCLYLSGGAGYPSPKETNSIEHVLRAIIKNVELKMLERP